jgi:hypothetical protein
MFISMFVRVDSSPESGGENSKKYAREQNLSGIHISVE